MRFLDVALSSLAYVQDFSVSLVATDGWNLYFHPGELGGLYRKNRLDVNRAYLHAVMHCIFRHMITRKGREKLWWNLACDIVTESIIDGWNTRNIRRAKSWLRQETYRKLQGEIYGGKWKATKYAKFMRNGLLSRANKGHGQK